MIIGRKDEIIFQSLHAHFEPVSGAAQNTAAAALPVEGVLESKKGDALPAEGV